MNIWVAGAGGIGCAFGARLAAAHSTLFIDGWREHVVEINARGLTVDYVEGPLTVQVPAAHVSEISEVGLRPDVVLVAFKSYQTREMMELLVPFIGDDTPIVSLQNGINEDVIASFVGDDRTIGGISLYDGALLGPGHGSRQRTGGKLIIGELRGGKSTRIEGIASALSTSLPTEVSEHIWSDLWSKLVRNTMFNAVSAMTGMGGGQMASDPLTTTLCIALGVEAVRVAEAFDIALADEELYGFPAEAYLEPGGARLGEIAAAFRNTYEPHPHLKSSMLQDVEKGRQTEIDYMNGFFVRKASEAGIPAPLNTRTVDVIKEIEAGRLKPSPTVVAERFSELLDMVN